MLPFARMIEYGNTVSLGLSGNYDALPVHGITSLRLVKSAYVSDSVYVYGGMVTGSTGHNNKLWRYDMGTGEFTQLSSGPIDSMIRCAFCYYDGYLYLYGGRGITSSGSVTNQILSRYNISTDTWSTISTTNLPGAREYCNFVQAQGLLYLAGGSTSADTTFYSYNPVSNVWVQLASSDSGMRNNAFFSTNTVHLDGIIYNLNETGLLQRYEISTNKWLPSLNTTFGGLLGVALGKVYQVCRSGFFEYSPATNTMVRLKTQSEIKNYYGDDLCSIGTDGAYLLQIFGSTSSTAGSTEIYKIT